MGAFSRGRLGGIRRRIHRKSARPYARSRRKSKAESPRGDACGGRGHKRRGLRRRPAGCCKQGDVRVLQGRVRKGPFREESRELASSEADDSRGRRGRPSNRDLVRFTAEVGVSACSHRSKTRRQVSDDALCLSTKTTTAAEGAQEKTARGVRSTSSVSGMFRPHSKRNTTRHDTTMVGRVREQRRSDGLVFMGEKRSGKTGSIRSEDGDE